MRSLNDVVVVDDNPDWLLSILAMEITTKGGYKSGLVLSVVILKPLDISPLKMILWNISDSQSKVLDLYTSIYYYRFDDHWVRVGSLEDLKSICQGIIADFDSKYLARIIHKKRQCIS